MKRSVNCLKVLTALLGLFVTSESARSGDCGCVRPAPAVAVSPAVAAESSCGCAAAACCGSGLAQIAGVYSHHGVTGAYPYTHGFLSGYEGLPNMDGGGVHYRYPYHSYRRPWFHPGPPSTNISIVW